MSEKLAKGIGPAFYTPFTQELQLNINAIPIGLRHLLDAQINFLFLNGATAEPTTLTMNERMKVAEIGIKEVAKQVPVIIHVGAVNNTEDAISLAKHAKKSGADAISSIPPLKRENIFEDVKYYKKVASSTDLPFYAYLRADMKNGDQITPERFLELMDDVPNFSGIKFTDYDLPFFNRLVAISNGQLNLLTGPDELFVAGLIMGSDGAIGTTYNLMPTQFIKMYKNFLNNNVSELWKEQTKANELIFLLVKYGLLSGMKALIEKQGIPTGPIRQNNILTPVKIPTKDQIEEMQKVVEKYSLI